MTQINPDCTLCPLHEHAKTVCMGGSGPTDARVIIVGEAPGADEDRLGEPFVGRAGQLLTQLLNDVGIDRSDCFITNAVKCRPPNNETPTTAQIGKCRVYLEDELKRFNPRVIIVLGNVPLRGVTGHSGITKARTDRLEYNGIPVVATFHPAYALRSPQAIDDIKLDLRRAASYLQVRHDERVEWSWGTVENDPLDYKSTTWAFDIETNGKDIGDPNLKVLLIGMTDGTKTAVYREPYLSLAVKRLEQRIYYNNDRRHILFGHNSIGFDSEVIAQIYKTYIDADDTLILAHQIDERVGTAEAHGKGRLETLAVSYLNVPPWKHEVVWDWDKLSDDQFELAAQYNAEDCLYTARLADYLIEEGNKLQVARGYEISKGSAIAFEHFVNKNGIAYDVERASALKAELTTDALDAHLQIQNLLGHEINLQSPQQVGKALFSDLGLEPHHFTDTGKPSTDELSIKSILVDLAGKAGYTVPEQVLRGILKYRENRKLEQFLTSYENLQVGGRLFPEYSVTSTVTYRTSSYNPNVQQWPHDKRVRGLLTAEPGHTLIEADYSQIELRLIADESGSQVMRDWFTKNIDPHRYMAALMVGKPMELVTDDERYEAKPVNFGLGYGGDPYTLKRLSLLNYDIVIPDEEAQRRHDLYHETVQLEPWYERIAKELKATGQVRNRLGRIRHLPNFLSPDPKTRLEALRQGINFPIQSFACDVALIAILLCIKAQLKVVAFIHDAVYIEVPDDFVDRAKQILHEIMVSEVPAVLAQKFNARINVPLDVDIKTTQRTKVVLS